MEDWVERLHQWGMRMRRRFRIVQDPLVRALAREKAASRNMHPDVLAQVELTDVGNRRNLSERKADPISIKRQKQCDEGWFHALECFGHAKEETLTCVTVLFIDRKVDLYDTNAKVSSYVEPYIQKIGDPLYANSSQKIDQPWCVAEMAPSIVHIYVTPKPSTPTPSPHHGLLCPRLVWASHMCGASNTI